MFCEHNVLKNACHSCLREDLHEAKVKVSVLQQVIVELKEVILEKTVSELKEVKNGLE